MASVLREIRENHPVAWYDLVERCRNDSHPFVKNPVHDSEKTLKDYRVLKDDGTILPIARATIGACVRGKHPHYSYRGILASPGIFQSNL